MDTPPISADPEDSASKADRSDETQTTPVKHLIVLIHGIRTHASWAEMVAAAVEGPKGVQAVPLRYPFFDVFRFLTPILTRRHPVNRIIRELRDLRAFYPDAKISVIAHSFGTYALIKALNEREIRVHRVILCGCVIQEGFRRADYGGQLGPDPILNDCGTHDIWPALARSMTWGYGSTGTFGFGTAGVHDRFNKFGHGDYFNKAFVEKYWVPFLHEGRIVSMEWEQVRTTPPWWLSLLNWFPFKYVGVALLLALAFYSWNLWWPRPTPPPPSITATSTPTPSIPAAQGVQIDFGPELDIGHHLGVPNVGTSLKIRNNASTVASIKNLNLTLISPRSHETAMTMQAIWRGNQASAPPTSIVIDPNDTVTHLYTFFNSNDNFVSLQQEASRSSTTNPLTTTPDPTKTLFPREFVERLQAFARTQFIWVPGEWQVRLTGTHDGRELTVIKTFTLTRDECDRMWAITQHYDSGIGVFLGWQGVTMGNYQPYLKKVATNSR